jgi:hypothetical protein
MASSDSDSGDEGGAYDISAILSISNAVAYNEAYEKDRKAWTDAFMAELTTLAKLPAAEKPKAPRHDALESLINAKVLAQWSERQSMDARFDSLLTACSFQSWLVHTAPRLFKGAGEDSVHPLFTQGIDQWLLRPLESFLEQADKIAEIQIQVGVALAAVLPGTWEGATADPLLRTGGGPALALVNWERAVLCCMERTKCRLAMEAFTCLGHMLAKQLGGAPGAGGQPPAAGTSAAFLRDLALLHGTRLLFQAPALALTPSGNLAFPVPSGNLVFPIEPPFEELARAVLAGGDVPVRHLEPWSALRPSSVHAHLTARLLREGKAGAAARVLQAGAYTPRGAFARVAGCVEAAAAYAPRLLPGSPARGAWQERPSIFGFLGGAVSGAMTAALGLGDGDADVAQLLARREARREQQLFAQALGLPADAPPAEVARAEEARALALAGGGGEGEAIARCFLARAASLFLEFAGAHGERERSEAWEWRQQQGAAAWDFAEHYYPALPLALADALDARGQHEEALEVIQNVPLVLRQAIRHVFSGSKAGWWQCPTWTSLRPALLHDDRPLPPGMTPLALARRRAALQQSEAQILMSVRPFEQKGASVFERARRSVPARRDAFEAALVSQFAQANEAAAERGTGRPLGEAAEAAEAAAHGLLGAFFACFSLLYYCKEDGEVMDDAYGLAKKLAGAAEFELPGGALRKLLHAKGAPERASPHLFVEWARGYLFDDVSEKAGGLGGGGGGGGGAARRECLRGG